MEPLPSKKTTVRILDSSTFRALRSLLRDKLATLCAMWLLLVVFLAIAAPFVAPYDYTAGTIIMRLKPPIGMEGYVPGHILGTDQIGRDVLSRLIFGARTMMIISLVVVGASTVIGTILGLAAGYFGGAVDNAVMRWVDIQTAFPWLLLAMAVVLALGPSIQNLILVLTINGWMVYARMVRGSILQERETLYIDAARVAGASHLRIMFKHLLPNVLNPLVTVINLEWARIVLAEATLSFIGLGIQPPDASWGLMMNDAQPYLPIGYWYLSVFPGACISITVLSINLFATWIRSYTDPLQRTMMARYEAKTS